ncbi:hypothetical protein [Actinomadura sp. K4S16]|uniref:hypothetical protein n=1 Tax=Actinomadura sp. K4S16 TaxID=1316147 RepID=UPI00190F6814|nr:hypothetical protein [Actinomadura sp. K4S16]
MNAIKLEATNAERSVLDAVEFLRALRGAKAALVPDRLTLTRPGLDGEPVAVEVAIDVEAFASAAWRKILRDKAKPGMLVRRHLEVCVFSYLADAGYPGNTDLVLEGGRPVLRRRKGAERRPEALMLEAAIHDRLPQRALLDILTRTAYLLGWHHHFGPASGPDPKRTRSIGT